MFQLQAWKIILLFHAINSKSDCMWLLDLSWICDDTILTTSQFPQHHKKERSILVENVQIFVWKSTFSLSRQESLVSMKIHFRWLETIVSIFGWMTDTENACFLNMLFNGKPKKSYRDNKNSFLDSRVQDNIDCVTVDALHTLRFAWKMQHFQCLNSFLHHIHSSEPIGHLHPAVTEILCEKCAWVH